MLTFRLEGQDHRLEAGDEPTTAAGLRGRLESVLSGVGADQPRLGNASIASPATCGDLRLVCAATKGLYSEQKVLFGTSAGRRAPRSGPAKKNCPFFT